MPRLLCVLFRLAALVPLIAAIWFDGIFGSIAMDPSSQADPLEFITIMTLVTAACLAAAWALWRAGGWCLRQA